MASKPELLLKALLEYLNTTPIQPDRVMLSKLLHDDIVWHFPGNGRGFASGTHEGLDDITALLSAIFTKVYKSGTFEYEFLHFFGDDKFGAAHYRVKAESVTGNHYKNEYALLARLEDGKLIELWEFLDTAYAQAKLFGSN